MTIENGPPTPPAHLAVFVNALGVDGAIAFLLRFGGAPLYVPLSFKETSEVVELVGADAAQALASKRDVIPARIPTGKNWIAKVWHSKGLSKSEIARRLHTTDKTVRIWLKSEPTPSDPLQPSLFNT